jgi:aromatic-amino-acid transaminase
LTAAEVAALQSDFGVYAVSTGRICIAGLNDSNVDYVAQAVACAVK